MVMKIVLSVVLVGALVCFAGPLAQTAPLQQRITQPIVMNGQQVQGVDALLLINDLRKRQVEMQLAQLNLELHFPEAR